MYKGDADYEYIEKVKNNPRMHIPVFANGDINTPREQCILETIWFRWGYDWQGLDWKPLV